MHTKQRESCNARCRKDVSKNTFLATKVFVACAFRLRGDAIIQLQRALPHSVPPSRSQISDMHMLCFLTAHHTSLTVETQAHNLPLDAAGAVWTALLRRSCDDRRCVWPHLVIIECKPSLQAVTLQVAPLQDEQCAKTITTSQPLRVEHRGLKTLIVSWLLRATLHNNQG